VIILVHGLVYFQTQPPRSPLLIEHLSHLEKSLAFKIPILFSSVFRIFCRAAIHWKNGNLSAGGNGGEDILVAAPKISDPIQVCLQKMACSHRKPDFLSKNLLNHSILTQNHCDAHRLTLFFARDISDSDKQIHSFRSYDQGRLDAF
jgi:hypothetical protein